MASALVLVLTLALTLSLTLTLVPILALTQASEWAKNAQQIAAYYASGARFDWVAQPVEESAPVSQHGLPARPPRTHPPGF